MSVRDVHFTLRAEDALRKIARMPELGIAYLERRHDLEKGSLTAWLEEFNGGEKALTEARIDAVKREVGAITTQDAAEARPKREAVPAIAPTVPPAAKDPEPPAAASPAGQEPWQMRKKLRRDIISSWIPALRDVAQGKSLDAAAKTVGKRAVALCLFKRNYFGTGRITEERFERFLQWCRANKIKIGNLALPGPQPIEKSDNPAIRLIKTTKEEPKHSAEYLSIGTTLLRFEIVVRMVSPQGAASFDCDSKDGGGE